MISDTTKKFRDIFCYGLLGVAALYLLSGISLLFKSSDESGAFAERAALFGYVFTHPFLILPLAAAVALAVGMGELSRNARIIVLAALAIGAVALLFWLISWFSAFGADGDTFPDYFGGIAGAGKIVGVLLGLAQAGLLAMTLFYAYTAFQSLPKAVPQAQQWGQPGAPQGYGPQQQGYPAQGGYPPQGYGDQQGGWGQGDAGYGQPQQNWNQQATDWSAQGYAGGASAELNPPNAGWGAPGAEQQGWGTPPQQPGQQAWPPAGEEAAQQPWQEQSAPQPAWEQPADPSYAQQSWDPSASAAPEADAATGYPDQTTIQPTGAVPAGEPYASEPTDPAAEPTDGDSDQPPTPSGSTVAGSDPADGTETDEPATDDGNDQSGWWQPKSR